MTFYGFYSMYMTQCIGRCVFEDRWIQISSSQGWNVNFSAWVVVVDIQTSKNLRARVTHIQCICWCSTLTSCNAASWRLLQCSCIQNTLMFHFSCSSQDTIRAKSGVSYSIYSNQEVFKVPEWRERLSRTMCVFMREDMVSNQKWGACFRVLTFILHTIIWITKTKPSVWKIWHQSRSCDQSHRVYTEHWKSRTRAGCSVHS